MNGYPLERYNELAKDVVMVTGNVLSQRPGTDPLCIRRWVLTKTEQGDVWLFAELDDQHIPKFEPYEAATHHLSSSLKGLPVLISNHTGLRYAFLLSPVRKLPGLVNFPDSAPRERMVFGVRQDGQIAGAKRAKINHMIVVGMTRSGKSSTLRSIAYQAMRGGELLAIADRGGRTFPMLAGNASLFCEIGKTEADYLSIVQLVNGEMDHRVALFDRMTGYPDNLEEYNQLAREQGTEPLPRITVILDEFNTAVSLMGGANGLLSKQATITAWNGLKYGVSVVFAAQDFSKEVIGKIRDQVDLVIAHRVQSEETARNLGVEAATRIPESKPGRAITNRWGLIQAFYLDKSMLIGGAQTDELTPDWKKVAARALAETQGKVSLEVLMNRFEMGQGPARRLQDEWKERGWAEKDSQRDNSLYITPKLADLLTNLQTLQTPTNRAETLQTGLQTAYKPDKPNIFSRWAGRVDGTEKTA